MQWDVEKLYRRYNQAKELKNIIEYTLENDEKLKEVKSMIGEIDFDKLLDELPEIIPAESSSNNKELDLFLKLLDFKFKKF